MCLRGYTTNQLLRDIDAASMSHSLEVRVPYLDPVVAEAALSLPDEAKLGPPAAQRGIDERTYRESGTKRILLDIAAAFLPKGYDSITKRGFGMPFDSWLRGSLNEVLLDSLSEDRVRRRGLLNPVAVTAIRNDFATGDQPWPRPWLLMMLELWFQQVLDRSRSLQVKETRTSPSDFLERHKVA